MLLLLALLAAAPVTARFTVAPGDAYDVLVRQNGKQLPCAATVVEGQPCELQLERGPATIVANGSPSFEREHEFTGSVTQTLAYRRTWPRWVGAVLIGAAVASFALGAIYFSRCSSKNLSDQVQCKSAYVGGVFGGILLGAGLPFLIWGLFTGDRTVIEPLTSG